MNDPEIIDVRRETYNDASAVLSYLRKRMTKPRSRGDMRKNRFLMNQLNNDYRRLIKAIGFLVNRDMLIIDKMWVPETGQFINMYSANLAKIRFSQPENHRKSNQKCSKQKSNLSVSGRR